MRGRYARIGDQVPLDTTLKALVTIGKHHQPIIYEGEGFVCKSCGRIGHVTQCPYTTPPTQNEMTKLTPDPTKQEEE